MGLICQLYGRTRTMELKVYYNYPFKSLAVTLHATTYNIQKFYLAITNKCPQHSSKTCCIFTNKVFYNGASAETGLQYGRQRNSHPNEPYFSDFSPRKYGSPG